jgi:FAD:protein FMN transferase
LEALPYVLLALVVVIATLGWNVNLNALEPFDAYVFRVAGVGAIVVFVVGLMAACFTPMAYCRFGCPTGALFGLLRSKGSSDKLGWREIMAGGLLATLLLTGCGEKSMSRVQGRAFGTEWSVLTEAQLPVNAREMLQAELERLEMIFSTYRRDSELSRWNQSTALEATPVSVDLALVLSEMKALSKETSGALDPTLGPVVRPKLFPSEALSMSGTGWSLVEVTQQPPLLKKLHAHVTLDPTCVVEGYALRRLDALLRSLGSRRHLIHLGGEVLALGVWPAGVQVPHEASEQGLAATWMTLENSTLSTAGDYRQPEHLIDPRTRRSTRHELCSVSVRDEDPLRADGLATALMVLGPEKGRELAEREGIEALFWVRQQYATPTFSAGDGY